MREIALVALIWIIAILMVSAGSLIGESIHQADFERREAAQREWQKDIKPREPDPEPIDESTVIVTAGPADK